MAQADWRGLYKFPTSHEQSLKYSTYGKKLSIESKDTSKCQSGCYVLVNIVGNMNLYKVPNQDEVPFRISINPRVFKDNAQKPIPKVKTLINEFVIGGLVWNAYIHQKYDYYSVILPYNREFVIFDFQADSPTLIIIVGE